MISAAMAAVEDLFGLCGCGNSEQRGCEQKNLYFHYRVLFLEVTNLAI